MEKYTNFKIKDTKTNTYVFFDIVFDEDQHPSLSFYFGTADPMEMNFESLGKIIAIAKWKTIPIWAIARENNGKYYTKLINNIEISHITVESFFDIEESIINFAKYDTLFSNADYKHQKTIKAW